jgi:GT2 family glycosyltransferase
MTPAMPSKRQFSANDVSLAVMNYNGEDKLTGLFQSIAKLVNPVGEVLMIDDGSRDDSVGLVCKGWPATRVIELGVNSGGVLNKVRNRAFSEATRSLVFIVDNDVELKPNCVEELIAVFNQYPEAAACLTRAVHWDDQTSIYQDGQILHYVGASPNTNRDAHIDEVDDEPRVSIGWGVQMIDKQRAAEVSFFNEAYILGWGDDGEINHKLNLYGYKCYQVPKAVVVHKRFESSKRYLAAVQNRLRFIAEMYRLRTIVLALPALIAYEASLVAFLVMKGGMSDYWTGWKVFFRDFSDIRRVRREIQAYRKLPDNQVMASGDIFVYSDYVNNKILMTGYKALNCFLNIYWRIIRKFV